MKKMWPIEKASAPNICCYIYARLILSDEADAVDHQDCDIIIRACACINSVRFPLLENVFQSKDANCTMYSVLNLNLENVFETCK